MIAALFVETGGVYFGDERIDPWDINRDALDYRGPHKVIAHPPCQRWGRYWGGGPMLHGTENQKLKGDDGNCFAYALWAVRTFGGVIEHPEASHAWSWFGLNRPPRDGGWVMADYYGGWTCCVAQGHYGHPMQKLTWLYGVGIERPDLKWGLCNGKVRMDDGFHSATERKMNKAKVERQALKKTRVATPREFKELLISLVSPKFGIDGEGV